MTILEKLQDPLSIYVFNKGAEIPTIETIGGKARNLCLLKASDIEIPDFLVLSVSFFESFIEDELADIDNLLLSTLQTKDLVDERLVSVADEIQQLILSKPFKSEHKSLIQEKIAQKFGKINRLFIAVRSSAIDEDSLTTSFAGQLESFLFVRADESLFDYIRLCFASAFNYRCLKYRLENNLSVNKIRTAVLLQKMIFGEVSGVLFTGNPLTNNPEETVVNACYGAGEGVVSGDVDADLWVLDETARIKTTKIADKNKIVMFDDDTGKGLKKVTIDSERASSACLTTQDIDQLVQIGKRIENFFGGVPQDIEWTIEASQLFILQSRPVSTMGRISKHLPRTILDNSNIIESFSGVTSPLTFSFASRVYERVYRQFYSLMGIPHCQIQALSGTFQNMLAFFNNRVYYNLNSWYESLSLLPGYELNKSNFDLSIGVKTVSDIEKVNSTSKFSKLLYDIPVATRSIVKIIYFYVYKNRICQKFLADFELVAGKYLDQDFSGYTNIELLEIYNCLERDLLERWTAPIINDFFTETFYGVLTKLIDSLDFKDNATGIQNDLLCGQGGVESVKPTQELMTIANWLKTQESLQKLVLEQTESELIEAVFSANQGELYTFKLKLEAYIQAFGYRCINELKLEEKTIKDDPTFVFQMLKNYLRGHSLDFEAMSNRERHVRQQAESKIARQIGNQKLKLKLFNWVIKNTRERVKVREELRFYRTKAFSIIRNIFNAIGKNLTNSKILYQPSDIYYLTISEVFELIENRSVNQGFTQELIALRKQQAEKDKSQSAPERIHIYGEREQKNYMHVISDEETQYSKCDEKANIFKGIGCSPGQVKAPVKIVLKPENVQLNGEILVTKRTDPGWVPLFPCISGLIVERGSVLSHSAVVAREMGIPTVVGLRGITDILQEGEAVVVDGSRGTVTRQSTN
jgi:rifampicin phosphotransferase